jgi:hypothetical protein
VVPERWMAHGRLANTQDWFVETPVRLLLDNGLTLDVADERHGFGLSRQ